MHPARTSLGRCGAGDPRRRPAWNVDGSVPHNRPIRLGGGNIEGP